MRSRRLVGLIAIAASAFATAAVLLPHSPSALRDMLLSTGPAAPAIALGAWVILVPALFPGTVLAAAGGLTFGAAGGAALAFVGAVGGGLVAFALGRTAAREPVERFVDGAIASIALGALAAAILVHRIRRTPPPSASDRRG